MDEHVYVDAAGFSNALMDLADEAERNIAAIITKSCLDLYRRIVRRTPVDTGRAKASWGIGTEHRDGVAPEGDHGTTGYGKYLPSDISAAVVQDKFTFTLGDDQVVIYNNLEYMSFLESGYSGQSPSGMVAISLSEFEAHFKKELASLQGLS